MNATRLWPLAIVAVLVITVAANVVLLVEARDPDAAAIEPDYYRKAVAWDSTLAQRARNAALGWQLDATLAPPAEGGMQLLVRLADSRGAQISDASITVEAIHNAAASHRLQATLRPEAGGGYGAVLPAARRGLWELRFQVTRGGERFTATLRREAGAP